MLLIIPNPAFFCIDTASGECYNRLSIDFCDEWAKTALNGAQRVCIRCEQMSAFGYPAHEHGKVKCIEPFCGLQCSAIFCAEVRYNFRGGVAAISRNKVVQCLTRPCEFFRTGAFLSKSQMLLLFLTEILITTEEIFQWQNKKKNSLRISRPEPKIFRSGTRISF